MEFIQRKIYFQLHNHLNKPEISLILGPRQAGKTTLMKQLAYDLKEKGRESLYFNLDVIEDRQFFVSQHTLLDQIQKRQGYDSVVFLDEIQRLENAGLFLKGLYDLNTGIKFIVSGSGSLELKANIIEPMTGRKKIFYCLPLSFTEFSAYKQKIDLLKCNPQTFSDNTYERDRLVNEYLTFGGYPRVVLAETEKEKQDILSEIYTSYLEKDIQILLGIEKDEKFSLLVKLLASQIGNLVNRAELAGSCGINEKTVNKYLMFLEKTFIISLVRPFFTNARKELRKSPKIYFLDLGFLALSQGGLGQKRITGAVFENACYLRLLELEFHQPIRFWRTTSDAEVDFILPDNQGNLLPLEVKLSRPNTLGRSLISFIAKYHPRDAYIYTKNEADQYKKSHTVIKTIPFHLFPDIEVETV